MVRAADANRRSPGRDASLQRLDRRSGALSVGGDRGGEPAVDLALAERGRDRVADRFERAAGRLQVLQRALAARAARGRQLRPRLAEELADLRAHRRLYG